jgi:Cd2+/Zn2+-exporting ATPase
MARDRQLTSSCPVCEVHAESVFKVEGMDCREEVEILERRLSRLAGIESLSADVLGQRLRVSYDAAKVSTSGIAAAVAEAGMRAWLEHEQPSATEVTARARQVLVVISGAALAIGFGLRLAGVPSRMYLPAFVAAILTGGIYAVRRAFSAARVFSLDINVLMLLAVAGAMAIGEWAEGATVIFLFAFAQLLEARSMARARHAIRALMDLSPAEALVHREGADQRVPIDLVRIGETLIVRPGEKIPLDGEVLNGHSPVNQAPITGESLSVDKGPGDEVFAGTINGRGALEVQVTRLRRDTTLARIVNLVETAQARRAPVQIFVDRFARYYTPAVIGFAVALVAVPPLLHGSVGEWAYRSLVLLVISCPCALVISTPVSVVSALAAAAREGVLIKGGAHLERTGAVRCVAFDKTGTLTRGAPRVVDVIALQGTQPDEVLRIAAALEARSEHPIAQAILKHAVGAGVQLQSSAGSRALPGLGAEGQVDGRPALVGNHRLFEDHGLCTPEVHEGLDRLAAHGQTAVLVAAHHQPLGIIGVADETREAGRDAIAMLRRQGVKHVVMLTGDHHGTAAGVARELGIDEVRAELLPEDKVRAVRDLREAYGVVAMVGDGVNDAPALAAADVGIAMGTAGTDAALETADVALMTDDLLKIPFTVRLSRATLRNIKANVAISLSLKAIFLVMAVAGVATLWMAVLADMGASLFVIANGLRLLRTT